MLSLQRRRGPASIAHMRLRRSNLLEWLETAQRVVAPLRVFSLPLDRGNADQFDAT